MSLNEDSLYDTKRIRRSAALNSNKAWAPLLVNKKGTFHEEDEIPAKVSDEEYSETMDEKSKKKSVKRLSKAEDDG